ncbi:DHH family phosphoesterase [Helicobacter sp. MIT 99-5507]|uniref:DHH family phosphoesterase n=1 Tax=Helicobacter sp. MIT 99-5507 TaxID=152489 RepID=UPI000E1E4017|nr:3',5'-cyclic-nucleotide phosphodiesterase [Helicobacter sp. MIT 99-5507]RDU57260.1 3',5'-cyclic-nucleotide phosphodiesterase [Helicobacter sp. MIT 99-5507]
MQVHHLSHIDLDGYGAQLVSKEIFDDIRFYNANYGKEVEVRLRNIIDNIKRESKSDFLILITDLNLNMNEAKFLIHEVNALNMSNKNVRLKLLDHHISGKDCADSFEWYHLDSSICASKIAFNVLKNEYKLSDEKIAWLDPFVEMINSADTWKEDGFAFDFGKVALGMIAQSREFTRFIFDDYDRIFKFNMLYEAKKYLLDSNNNLRENANVNFDNNIFLFKKTLLGGDVNTQTMEEILSNKQTELLSQNKDEYSIFYKDKKGLLTYSIGGISILANLFLKENSEFDFFIDIGVKGNVSIRANGNCDVSMMSKDLFGGGGHKNAAGGKFDGFKETFLYEEAKEQVINLIHSKE